MKRLAFAVALAILLAPAAAAAKDAGPATKAPAVKKDEPKKEAPASQPTKAEVKTEVKTEGKKEDVKLTPPDDDFDLWGSIQDIITKFKEGKVWDGISIILMVMTFLFFKFKENLPVKYAVWIAAGLGIATNIVSAIIGGVDWGPAVATGLTQGAAAGGFWTMFGKHIFRSRLEKDKRRKAREMAEDGKASGSVETNEDG
jgi:hypothetical protein